MFSLLFSVAKYIVVCAGVLVYVELGPGGEYVGNMVDAVKAALITVDWAGLWVDIKAALLGLLDSLSGVMESSPNNGPESDKKEL